MCLRYGGGLIEHPRGVYGYRRLHSSEASRQARFAQILPCLTDPAPVVFWRTSKNEAIGDGAPIHAHERDR